MSKDRSVSQRSYVRNVLLYVLFTVLFYVFIAQSALLINSREYKRLPYDGDYEGFVISDQYNKDGSVYFLGNNWIYVPNVTYNSMNLNHYPISTLESMPYASGVSISDKYGWNDLGETSEWHNTDAAPELYTFKNGTDTFYSSVYATRIKLYNNTQTLNLSIPNINGTAYIFCNGIYQGYLGDSSGRYGLSFSFGYSGIPIHGNSRGDIELVIAVESDVRLPAPGITSNPALGDKSSDMMFLVVSSGWLALILIIFLFSIIGGIILARTFRGRSKLYYLISLEILFILFTALDVQYLFTPSFAKAVTMNILTVLLAILGYLFEAALFSESEVKIRNPILKHDKAIVLVLGAILIAVNIICRSSINITAITNADFIFTIAITSASFLKALLLYIWDKNSIIGTISSLTFVFIFIYMYDRHMTMYDVPVYSVYFVIAFTAIEIFILTNYVKQFRYLEAESDRLQYMIREKTQHITEINRDLLRTNKKLMENEEARKNVLSNVSHDLRTPITAIRGYAELLITAGKNMKPEQIDNYLQNILKRSNQMERIVSDIVELTRMESNTNEFHFTDVSMAELLDELYMMYEGDLRGTDKKLTLELPDTDLLIVKADPKKISRVFENLISNAINYTYDEALIKIRGWREKTEKPTEEQEIHITISDNGIGIPEEEISHVFDRFYRAKNSGQNIKGTGLGLSIVKTITDHHKAQISVKSTLGSGTEFHIIMKATY